MSEHPNSYGDKPLHDSDRIVTATIEGKSRLGWYEVTHCRHCGVTMTRPVKR